MEVLKTVSSRMLLNQKEDEDFKQDISHEEREWCIQKCKELDEWDDSSNLIVWIKKIKKQEYKRQKRILLITPHRLLTIKKEKDNYDVARAGHILDLVEVQESGLILSIKFRDFQVAFAAGDDMMVMQILHCLYRNYMLSNPSFPQDLACKWLDNHNHSQEQELAKKVPVRAADRGIWDKPVRAFTSYCSFYKDQNSETLPNGFKSLLSRKLVDDDEERWIKTSDLNISDSKLIYGLIMSVAFTNNLVHGIEISDCVGTPEIMQALLYLMKYNITLKSLILDGIATGPEWGNLLFDGLNQNQKSGLYRFGLLNAKITEKGVNSWIVGNKKLAQQPECIYLTKSGGTSKQMVQFIQSLIGKTQYGNGLCELDLTDNPLEAKGTQTLAHRIMDDFCDLKVLRLGKCMVEISRLLNAIEKSQDKGFCKLEELDLSYNKMSTADGLVLSRILAKGQHMGSLNIAGTGLQGNIIAAVCASLLVNENLKYYVRLDASNNNIGCEDAIMIASVFSRSDRLMSVKLNNCDLTHEGMGYLLFSLENQPHLRILELDNNCKRVDWNTGKYYVNQQLRKILECCVNLESLSIKSDPELGYQIDLDHFLLALQTNSSLLALDITGNLMTNDNHAALKEVVIKNHSLQELHWDLNNITSRQIQGITHALKQNVSLTLVEFPEKDFEKELSQYHKDKKRQMELQIIRKNFMSALFDNNTRSGFQASPVQIKRKSARRNSIMATNPDTVRQFSQQPKGQNKLMIPQAPSH